MKYKVFIMDYEKHVVFTKDGKQYTRKLYKVDDNIYYIYFKNKKVVITKEQLHY